MRILVVTGRLAEPVVRGFIAGSRTRHSVSVIALPITVVALASTELIARLLVEAGVKRGDYDLIILPGLCRGSARAVEEAVGIRAVKGTRYASDLPLVLELDDPASILSSDEPADEVIAGLVLERNKGILRGLEEAACRSGVRAGDLCIPASPPPIRVMAEVSDCHRAGVGEVVERARAFFEAGADLVSLGFEAGSPHPDLVYSVVRAVKREVDRPIAVDSIIPSEIRRGVEAGADLVMSIELGNVEKVAGLLGDTPYVAIPYDSSSQLFPRDVGERIGVLERVIERARRLGARSPIGDIVLDPPIVGDTLSTLYGYRVLKERNPGLPLLMGIGNVAEFMDVDSVGVNALLTILALHARVSIVLVVEKSSKARGSVAEAKIASQMASLAYARKTPPKDLGIDLLILKDKRREETPLDTAGARIVEARESTKPPSLDPIGFFKIRVNHRDKVIEALYTGRKGRILIRGKTAKAIRDYIAENKLATTISHALYLGAELAKAEEALRTGKTYIQEKPLFKPKKPLDP